MRNKESKKYYIVKNLSPWMLDEIIVLANYTEFELLLLRKPNFKNYKLDKLYNHKSISINYLSSGYSIDFKKIKIIFSEIIKNVYLLYGLKNLIYTLKAIYWFLKIEPLKLQSESLLHAQFATQASIISYFWTKYNPSCKYAFTFHAYDIFYKNKWFPALSQNAERICSISKYNVEYIIKKYHTDLTKIQLSYLGVIQPDIFEKQSNKKLNFGFLSWFTEKKGLYYLIDAIAVSEKIYSNATFTLAGDGPEKQKIEKLVSERALNHCVTFTGTLNDTAKEEFYKSIDVFVLPSITLQNDMDGIPVVLMEAVSYGIPLISTNISGIPEICKDKYNGILINEKDSEELSNALLFFIDNRKALKTMAENAKNISNDFNLINNTYSKFKKLMWL